MQCINGKKSDKHIFFSKVLSSPRLHLTLNTLQYSPRLYNETDNTECTSWYAMDICSQLEDLDYAHNIALISITANHMQKKAQLLTENTRKCGTQIYQKKTKVMCMYLKEYPQVKIDDMKELEVVTDFTYLGSNINVENSVHKDISTKINKARNSYCGIRNIIWNLTYTAYRPKCNSSISMSYQYYYMDAKAGDSTRMI